MKFYATESNINLDKHEKLENEIAEFLAKGGAITKVDNKGNFVKQPILTGAAKSNVCKMTENNKAAIKAKEDRLRVQRPIFEHYNEAVSAKDKWAILSRRVGGVIKPWQLKKVAYGLSSILEKKVFDTIEKAIYEIVLEHEKFIEQHKNKITELKRKGISCNEKITRIIVQQPVILAYCEKYPHDTTLNALSATLGGLVSPKHLRNVKYAESSIANNQTWLKIESKINQLLEQENEQKKAS